MGHQMPHEFRTKWHGRPPQDHGSRPSMLGVHRDNAMFRHGRDGDQARIHLALALELPWMTGIVTPRYMARWMSPSDLAITGFWTRAEMAATVPSRPVTRIVRQQPEPVLHEIDQRPSRPAGPRRSSRRSRATSAPIITVGELSMARRRGSRQSTAEVTYVTRDDLVAIARRRNDTALIAHIEATYAVGERIPVPAQ